MEWTLFTRLPGHLQPSLMAGVLSRGEEIRIEVVIPAMCRLNWRMWSLFIRIVMHLPPSLMTGVLSRG